jgi:hypothetical protein
MNILELSSFFKFMPIIYRGLLIKKLLLLLLLPLAGLSAEVAETYETDVSFRGFPWGTSMNDFVKKMGRPVSREQVNGLDSLLWENVDVNGFTTYMIAYFSRAGLQGGTYYFVTATQDEDIRCYSGLRQELRDRYGPTILFDGIIRELRAYECSWELPGGYVYLMVNARQGDPVTLWYSSPELTRQVFGKKDPVTAKK